MKNAKKLLGLFLMSCILMMFAPQSIYAIDSKTNLLENKSTNGILKELETDNSSLNSGQSFSKEESRQKNTDTSLASTKQKDSVRYTVLILDASGSMKNTPISVQREAAKKFCNSITEANGKNYVAIVELNTGSYVKCNFTTDIGIMEKCIDNTYASGGTNINKALQVARDLLDNIPEQESKTIKNIVLCSDGLPQSGEYLSDGPYSSFDNYYYRYANAAYNTAKEIKETSTTLYTLGFFHSLSGNQLSFGRRLMTDLASTDSQYYEVTDVDKLEFTFGEIADDIKNEVKEITFKYQSGKDYSAKCYYTDDYFKESSYTYNASLATMTLSYAMSAFGSDNGGQTDYTNKSNNAKALLKEIGVADENIKTNDWFTVKPTTDSIGVIIGNKKIKVNGKDNTLIAIAVRGAGYEREWASNLTIGRNGQHEGFSEAKENVLSFLKQYVKEQKISGDVKIWVTGYSRAAATANLVSGAIDDGVLISDDISYSNEDVYSYCFETPAGALASEVKGESKYSNIFNIINPSDPVPYVAPAIWGFDRYGIVKYTPSAENSKNYYNLKSNMLNIYESLDSTSSYTVDDFKMKKLSVKNWLPGGEEVSFIQDDTKNNFSQGVFLSKYVRILAGDFFKTRDNYVEYYQEEIREICSVVFGCSDEQSKILMNSIVNQAKDEWGSLVRSYIWNVGIKPWGSESDALQIISDWLINAVEEAEIEDYNQATLDEAGKKLGDLMLALISNHPNYFTTAIMNGSKLGEAHYPELCYSWLASMDSNYTGTTSDSFNNGGYRIIRINCDVDVDAYDSTGTLVASIIDENPQQIENSNYIAGIDQDGQKYIILPNEAEYKIIITARNDDSVNYSINEYSALVGDYTRVINYFDIKMKQGEKLTGTIPAYAESEIENDTPDGSSVGYILTDHNDKLIESNSDLKGKEALEAYYDLSVLSSNPKYGVALGTSIHQYGDFAQVEAVALDGYRFTGWYINDECISVDDIYRVCVTNDIELIAHFEPSNSDVRNYKEPVFNWATNYLTCTATFSSTDGEDIQDIECVVDSKKSENEDEIIYTATVKFNGNEYTDTKTISVNEKDDEKSNNTENKTDNQSKETKNNNYDKDKLTNTGDRFNIGLWVILGSIALILLLLFFVLQRRSNK